MREWLSHLLAEWDAPEGQWRHELLLAVGEAVSNVCDHAYAGGCGPIGLAVYLIAPVPQLVVEVEDCGPGFDPPVAQPTEGERGRGRLIMEALCKVTYERRPNSFVVRLAKPLAH